MKKTLITILMSLLALSMFVSCKDDPEPEISYSVEITVQKTVPQILIT